MKRLFQIALIILIFIAAFIGALPLLLSTDTMRERLIAHVSDITPGEVSFEANPGISFNPFLGVEISDFKIQDPLSGDEKTNLLTVEKVKAKLDILPALVGQISISEYQFVRPILNLKVYTDGKSNWTPRETILGEMLSKYRELQTQQDGEIELSDYLPFGRFNIVDGLIEYEDAIADNSYTITGVDGDFNWPTTADDASYSGVAVWRGEILNTKFTLQEVVRLFVGGESEVSVSINSNPVNLAFDGKANMLSNLFVTGNVDLETPSINRITEFLALDLGGYSNLEAVKASGTLEATADTLTLTEADISINENIASGLISITSDQIGNIALDGTLAFEQINADVFPARTPDNEAQNDEEAIESNFSSDLRISAKSFVSGALEFTDLAASVSTRGYEWTFDIGDATIFDGHIIAKLGERKIEDKFQNFINIDARDINTAELVKQFPENILSLTGTSNFKADLSSNYKLDVPLLERLNGTVNLDINDGSIIGLNLPGMIQNSQEDTNQRFTLNSNDQTAFSNFLTQFTLHNGLAYITNTSIKTENSAVKLAGSINLANDAWVLRATSDAKNSPSIVMGGTIKAPLILYSQNSPQDIPPEVQSEDQDNEVSN